MLANAILAVGLAAVGLNALLAFLMYRRTGR